MERLVPKLRFPGFGEDFRKHSLGDICKFSKGKGVSKSDITSEGKNECIRYGELYTTYNEIIQDVVSRTDLEKTEYVLSEVNDIIIPSSGESAIDIATASCVLREGVLLGGDLNILKTNENGVFLSYYLNNQKKSDIAKLAQGNTVVHLYNKGLATLGLSLPSLPEQTKIAEFLTTIDKRIELLTAKKEKLTVYKKGVMQRIFNQEIRFKQDDGGEFPEWIGTTLGDIADIKRGAASQYLNYVKNEGEGVRFLRINDFLSNDPVYVEATESIKRFTVKTNDLLIAGTGATAGITFIVPEVFNELPYSYNAPRIRVRAADHHLFIYYYLKSDIILRQQKALFVGNAQPFLDTDAIRGFKISLPSFKEQKRIAEFLNVIDIEIEKLFQQITLNQTYKKGLLQQMFV